MSHTLTFLLGLTKALAIRLIRMCLLKGTAGFKAKPLPVISDTGIRLQWTGPWPQTKKTWVQVSYMLQRL